MLRIVVVRLFSTLACFQWLLASVVALLLLGPNAAWAANIRVDDTSPNGKITITADDFESGFFVNGTEIQLGLGNPGSITIPESAGAVSFHGEWIDLGQTSPGSRTIYLVETCNPQKISDVLQFTLKTDGFQGTIDATFISGPKIGLGQLPPGVNANDVFVEDGTPAPFTAPFLTGAVISDQANRHNCP